MRLLHVGCGRKQVDARELLEGCGLTMALDAEPFEVTHLDADARLLPDIVHRLGSGPIVEVEDESIDLIVAWHVLEHIGRTGEAVEWFTAWEEFYRILKPGGWIYAECPHWDSVWAWGDPTHTRAISQQSFAFFAQDAYRIPGSPISPYRIAADFRFMGLDGGLEKGWAVIQDANDPDVRSIRFALQAIKPLRPWWKDVTK